MGSLSNYYELIVLDTLTGKSPSTTRYIALTASGNAITDSSTGSTIVEPSGNNYSRKSTSASDWASASSGATSNAAAITFPTASGSWGTISYFAICDSGTTGAGNILAWGAITTPKAIDNGDTASFAIGDIDITID